MIKTNEKAKERIVYGMGYIGRRKRKNQIQTGRRELFRTAIILLAFAAVIFTVYKCPVKLLFGIECPGCGMTRAYKSLFRMDLVQAYRYHSLFPIPMLVFLYQLFHRRLDIGRRKEAIVLFVFIMMFFIRWFFILLQ